MKKITRLFGVTLLLMAFFATSPVAAQDQDDVNVKKELKTVLKELPPEMQVQVLRYAERKRDAYVAMQEKMEQAEAARSVAAEGVGATEQPAQPAQPEQRQAATPQPSNSNIRLAQPAAAAATPAAPKQPAYIQQAQEMAPTSIEWYDDSHDFGKIQQGQVASHTYRFKNTGTEPLKLTRVKPSCGCTTPEYSKEEVAPGEEGFITVNFNTAGKSGVQRKSVTVTGNFEGFTKVLRFQGEIQKAAPAAPAQGAGGSNGGG